MLKVPANVAAVTAPEAVRLVTEGLEPVKALIVISLLLEEKLTFVPGTILLKVIAPLLSCPAAIPSLEPVEPKLVVVVLVQVNTPEPSVVNF